MTGDIQIKATVCLLHLSCVSLRWHKAIALWLSRSQSALWRMQSSRKLAEGSCQLEIEGHEVCHPLRSCNTESCHPILFSHHFTCLHLCHFAAMRALVVLKAFWKFVWVGGNPFAILTAIHTPNEEGKYVIQADGIRLAFTVGFNPSKGTTWTFLHFLS